MPNWKKLIVSGSDANLNSLNIESDLGVTGSLHVLGSITGSQSISASNIDQDVTSGSSPSFNGENIDGINTVSVDSAATAGYIGSTSSDGVIRTDSTLNYVDGGNFVTLGFDTYLKENINGFEDPIINVTDSFTNGTRTLQLSPTATSFSFWSGGNKYIKSVADSIVISADEGIHYIYYDTAGTLIDTTVWNDDIILKYAIVAAIYWDATNSKQIYYGREFRHSANMSGQTHFVTHVTDGFKLESGGSLGDFTIGNGTLDAHAQFSCETTTAWDEDARFQHTARLSTDILPILYKTGTDGSEVWRIDETNSFPVTNVGTGRAAYNELNGTTWQLTEAGNNNYILAHVATCNDTDRPFVVIVGENQYNTLSDARDGIETEINELILNGLPFAEFKFLGSVILQTADNNSNSVKSEIVTLSDGSYYLDLRGQVLGRSGDTVTVTDHGTLSGLGDDDHIQYLLVDGTRALTGDWNLGNNQLTNVSATGSYTGSFIGDGSNLTGLTESQIIDLDHYTSTDFNTDFSSKSTTDLSEGNNLYYTDTRVKTKLNIEDVISGSSQVNYNEIQNQPTIGDGTITISGSDGISGNGLFNLNDTGDKTIALSHEDTSTLSGVYGGESLKSLTVDSKGHVTAVETGSLGDSSFGYIEFEARTLDAPTPDSDNIRMYSLQEGTSPNKTITLLTKNQLGEQVILSTLVV